MSNGGPGDPLGGPRTGKTPRSRAIESMVHREPEAMSQLSVWRVRVIVWTRLDGDESMLNSYNPLIARDASLSSVWPRCIASFGHGSSNFLRLPYKLRRPDPDTLSLPSSSNVFPSITTLTSTVGQASRDSVIYGTGGGIRLLGLRKVHS